MLSSTHDDEKSDSCEEECTSSATNNNSNDEYDASITAPNGAVIKVRMRGNVAVPYGKVDFIFGGAAKFDFADEEKIRELQAIKQAQRKEFDSDPQNEELLNALKDKRHNYERSISMAQVLIAAGLAESREQMMLLLLDAGSRAAADGDIVDSSIEGTNGTVQVSSVWRFILNGDIALDAVDIRYLTTVITKPIDTER